MKGLLAARKIHPRQNNKVSFIKCIIVKEIIIVVQIHLYILCDMKVRGSQFFGVSLGANFREFGSYFETYILGTKFHGCSYVTW